MPTTFHAAILRLKEVYYSHENKEALWIVTIQVKQARQVPAKTKCESWLLLFILGHAVQDKVPVSSKPQTTLLGPFAPKTLCSVNVLSSGQTL